MDRTEGGTQSGIPDLTAAMVLFEGGWDLRYAEVLAVGTAGRFGLALVDTNGDGREINDVLFHLAPEGWREGSSSGGVPATGRGVLGQRLEHGHAPSFAYGRAKSSGPLRVQLADGREVDVVANDRRWWVWCEDSDEDTNGEAPPGRS